MEPFYQQIGSTGIGIRRQSIVLVDVLRMVLLAHQMMIEIGRHMIKRIPNRCAFGFSQHGSLGRKPREIQNPETSSRGKRARREKNEKVLFPPCTILGYIPGTNQNQKVLRLPSFARISPTRRTLSRLSNTLQPPKRVEGYTVLVA
jgi:hypothetical protein